MNPEVRMTPKTGCGFIVKIHQTISAAAKSVITKIQDFVNKHFTGIFFGVTALGTLYFAPKFFLVGMVGGLVVSRIVESRMNSVTNSKLVTHISSALELTSFVGAALSYPNPASYMIAFPLVGGVVAGHFLYSAFRMVVPFKPKAEALIFD